MRMGEPGPEQVLVVTQRDEFGDPIESVWVDASIAWQYDDTRWNTDPIFRDRS